MSDFCLRCRRRLTGWESRSRGFGPDCWEKFREESAQAYYETRLRLEEDYKYHRHLRELREQEESDIG